MKMSKILVWFIAILLSVRVCAQQTILIEGAYFEVSFNVNDGTAEIRDYTYQVDDREYPMHNRKRLFPNFKNVKKRTLTIPETVSIGGEDYVVTTIGRAAFAGYQNVDHVVIPNTVEIIEEYAFFRTSIKTVIIPQSVQSIGRRAFGYCPKLENLTLYNRETVLCDGLYAESKNVVRNYVDVYDNENYVSKRTSFRKKKESITPIAPIGPSDVDIDIPTVSASNSETFAIIIANENYQSEVTVKFAHNDGRIFRSYCQSVLGIPEENIRYREDATLNNILAEVNWVTNVARVYGGDARIIVYYAGHGMPDESTKTAYLLPVDGSGSDFNTGYSLDKLYKALGELPCKHVTVFLDACFSGSQRGDGMLANTRGVAIKARESAPQGKMVVFSAAQGDETAWPYAEKGHGLFTYYLLKKLKETKGNVTYGELGDYIQKEVSRRAIVVNSKPQTPTASPSSNLSDTWRKLKLR